MNFRNKQPEWRKALKIDGLIVAPNATDRNRRKLTAALLFTTTVCV